MEEGCKRERVEEEGRGREGGRRGKREKGRKDGTPKQKFDHIFFQTEVNLKLRAHPDNGIRRGM
jgi:hypothetical protein